TAALEAVSSLRMIYTENWFRFSGSCALLRPLAFAEHWHLAAVGQDAVDVGLGRADHPVDMDQALVAALRGDLLRRELGAVDEALRIALAERDVRSCVLVEQRVVEQQPTLRDRRGMRHQGHLAETARALVGVEHLVQYL